tara:strand:+ start:253 stop:1245 length:993 start_codon:yes stop_codon:yes gene_type:complete
MSKKVLIIGATGILGYAFQELNLLDIKSEFKYIFPKRGKLDLLKVESIKSYLEDLKPNYIVNCAALSGSMSFTSHNQIITLEANISHNLNIIKAISLLSDNRPEKVCFIGSTAVYGDMLDSPSIPQDPITEKYYNLDDLTEGNYGYSVAKSILPCLSKTVLLELGIPFITLVPSGICGFSPFIDRSEINRSNHTFLISVILKLIEALISGANSLDLPGTGKDLRQFDYSHDLARIINWALSSYDEISPLNIVSFGQCSIEKYASIIQKTLGLKPDYIRFKHKVEDSVAKERPIVSNEKFKLLNPSFCYTRIQDYLPIVVEKYLQLYKKGN